ncbi:hypothetical protein MKW98_019213 [Papaver atlanticum]|uniref:Uncharacterized protein n=1 Tax=Papaver atlanticum TaxID=357466 RepID=A0AAD4XV30_9MAGN|nr:hypothetical protein MKW98_019213 [Papaver atlanticum]
MIHQQNQQTRFVVVSFGLSFHSYSFEKIIIVSFILCIYTILSNINDGFISLIAIDIDYSIDEYHIFQV